jgi:hypothetical protein
LLWMNIQFVHVHIPTKSSIVTPRLSIIGKRHSRKTRLIRNTAPSVDYV